jgi:5-methylcytosine-specific restriction endonuclease McrA
VRDSPRARASSTSPSENTPRAVPGASENACDKKLMIVQTSSSSSEAAPTLARQLVQRLSSRLENEKRELVLFLIELGELDAKKLALELGYPSTLGCLVRELGLTESSACRRIAAARLLARFPQVAGYLLANRLTLTGLVALRDVLSDSNVDELLERASGLSEPDVRQLVMRIRFGGVASSQNVDGQIALATPPAATVAADAVATSTGNPSAEPREELQAVTLWVGREFREELEAVRALLGHAVPSGKREEVLLQVLRAQRKILERRRYGSPKGASKSPPSPANADYVPAAVRREVYEREGGSCAYVGEGDRRCGSTLRLELQHIVPLARGGKSTPENVTLFCRARRAHNLLQAEKDFGEHHVKRKQLERRAAIALVGLGYKRRDAEEIVRVAIGQLPRGSDLKALLQRSLRMLAP